MGTHWTTSSQITTMTNSMAKILLVVSVAVAMSIVMADPEPEPGKPKGVSYGYASAPVYSYRPQPVYRRVIPVRRFKGKGKAPKAPKGFKAPKFFKAKAPKAPKGRKVVRVARPVYRPAPVYSHGYY